jgi:putative membrane protein
MKQWFINLIVTALLLLLFAEMLDGVYIESFLAALQTSFLLSIVNVIVRPLLIFLTLPLTILSLGLFVLVINALMLTLTDFIMGSAFDISNFFVAILIAVLLSVSQLFIQKLILKKLIKK